MSAIATLFFTLSAIAVLVSLADSALRWADAFNMRQRSIEYGCVAETAPRVVAAKPETIARAG